MTRTPVLETPRLTLRPLRGEDAGRTQEIFPHWEIVRLLANAVPWPFPPNEVERYYREVALPGMERGDEWHWTLRPRGAPARHIGALSLFRGPDDNRGFWLGLPWQGQGLMTEAVIATNDFWFETLGMAVLRAPKAVVNAGSRRISEKTGMRVVRTMERDFVSGRLPSELWELTAAEWAAAKQTWQTASGAAPGTPQAIKVRNSEERSRGGAVRSGILRRS